LAAVALATFSAAIGVNAQAATWNTDVSNASWIVGTNWTAPATAPNGPGAVANLTNNITNTRGINLNAAVTIGTLTAGDSVGPFNNFIINSGTGTNALTFDADVTTLDIATINRNPTGGGSLRISSSVVLNDPLVITWVGSTGDLRFSGAISGSGSAGITVKSGGSSGDQVRLDNTLSYAGDTTLDGGYVGVWTPAILPFGAGKGNVNVNNNVSEVSTLAFWATGTQNINGLNGNGLVVQVGNPSDVLTLQVGNGDANGNFSGVVRLRADITDPANRVFNFVKTGTGTQVLSGNNLYNGTTTVSPGKLLVNGTHTGGSAYTVGDTLTPAIPATLGGGGSTTSAVTVNANGHLAPGNSIGTFGSGALTIAGVYDVELGTPGTSHASPGLADLTNVTGNLNYSAGTLNLINNAGNDGNGSVGAGSYKIFTYTGTNAGSFSAINQVGSLLAQVVDDGNNGSGGTDGVYLDLYDPALASFDDPLSTVLNLDIGTFNEGDGPQSLGFDIYNLLQTAGFTAELSLLAFPVTGDVAELSTDLAGFTNLAPGGSNSFLATLSTATPGVFSESYDLILQSTGFGSSPVQHLTLNLSGTVVPVPEPNAIILAGIGLIGLPLIRKRRTK